MEGRRQLLSLLLLNLIIATLADFAKNCPQVCNCLWASGNKKADCSNAHLTEIPKALSQEIQNLDLEGNDLREIPRLAFYFVGLINLKKLILRECNLTVIQKNAFNGLELMMELDLSKNDLHELHSDTFKEIVKVRWIFLNDNKLQKLEDGLFNNLPFLQKVYLNNNRIVTLGMKTFMNVPKLGILRLDGNKLEHLKIETLSALTSLFSLEIYNNPWRCDCFLEPFKNWVISNDLSIIMNITCTEPPKVHGKFWKELDSNDFVCKPSIVYPSLNTTLKTLDSNVTMSCHVIGNPLPSVNWVFNSQIINETYRHQNDTKKYNVTEFNEEKSKWVNLTIFEASSIDNGQYLCVANNSEGVEERIVTLAITSTNQAASDLPSPTKDGRPGYSYHDELHGWLKLHRQPTTWRAARISCHVEGAFLASAWTAKFALSLKQLQSGGEPSLGVVPTIYSGFHTTSAEGAFTFANGKPAITLDHDGLAALERCVAYFANGTSGDVDCDLLLPYVCYVPAPASASVPVSARMSCPTPAPCPAPITCPTPAPCPAPTTSPSPAPCPAPTTCPSPPPCPTSAPITCSTEQPLEGLGYEFVKTTGSLYKYYTEAKSWEDAKTTCHKDGAHLAIINSKIEAEALVALHEKYQNKIITTPSDILFVGMHTDLSGVWKTVDGQTIEQAGYDEWYPGYPYEPNSGEGMMLRDGTLLHGSHHSKLPFICEMNKS